MQNKASPEFLEARYLKPEDLLSESTFAKKIKNKKPCENKRN